MNSELVSLGGSGLSRRAARELGSEVARVNTKGLLKRAEIEMETDLQTDRVGAVAYVGKRALQEMALLSALEVQLTALVPAAQPRLQGLGDLTAVAMADVVSETVRKVK